MKLKNKILSAIMLVAASMTLVSVSAFAASYSFNPSSVEVKAGETFTLDLVTADVVDICTIQFYATGSNETFTLTGVEDTKLYGDPLLATDYSTAEYTLAWSPDAMWENGGVDDAGTAAKLTYKVNDNVAPGTYTVTVYCDSELTMDYEENEIDFGTATATIKVVADAPATEDVVIDDVNDFDYTDVYVEDGVEKKHAAFEVSFTVEDNNNPVEAIEVKGTKAAKVVLNTAVKSGTANVFINVLGVPADATLGTITVTPVAK